MIEVFGLEYEIFDLIPNKVFEFYWNIEQNASNGIVCTCWVVESLKIELYQRGGTYNTELTEIF